jgi:hypothetical protein
MCVKLYALSYKLKFETYNFVYYFLSIFVTDYNKFMTLRSLCGYVCGSYVTRALISLGMNTFNWRG